MTVTDTASSKMSSAVVVDAQSSGSIGSNISLHPLPILNISEHLVRTRLQSNDATTKVYGILLGTQQGRDIEIQNTFELNLGTSSAEAASSPMINHAFLKSRQEQYKQVFPTLDLLGWYTIGSSPTPDDLEVHKQLLAYHDTPILVQLSQSVASFETADKDGELPIHVYESVVELVKGETTSFFVPAGYRIETGEAERIAVDYASKDGAGTSSSSESTMLASITTQYNAISKMNDRIKTVLTYLDSVQSGTATWDHEAVRQIQTVGANLPKSILPELQQELLREHNDVLLTNYLSVMTESVHALNELTDKFEVVQGGAREEKSGVSGDVGLLRGSAPGSGPTQRSAARSSASQSIYAQ